MVLDRLTACGLELDMSETGFGTLHESTNQVGEPEVLRANLERDGYLFIRGFFGSEDVLKARRSILARLAVEGAINLAHPIDDAKAVPGLDMAFRPEFANGNPEVARLLYSDHVLDFYRRVFGKQAKGYDFTWLRAMAPGKNTYPHYDVVYMGRGTPNVLTLWTPLGDVPFQSGGLMVLENSHRVPELLEGYGKMDVDAMCENKPGVRQTDAAGHPFGAYSFDPVAVRKHFGGRWLSANYRTGDLLTFKITLMHASLDNHSDAVRLSTDSRYQPADEPFDERWVGEHPIGHGDQAHRSLIC